ncbi:hypothetical protein C2G38_2237331 [Gigaspora rosea]|uniref:Uncharacterized protein n=1 Tax=Gigaspora rosea TaxID=44941 RepID=A0A397TPE1_9GLOM|nr:hypothetical protein C2G38_2237331 [Gigaspora rosea]
MTIPLKGLSFLEFGLGNINKSNKYTAQDMHDELVQLVQEGEIKIEEVPKVSTIQNWIGCYTHEHKQEAVTKKAILLK